VRQLARVILERYGYTVVEADSGQTALDVWRRAAGTVDLLLADLVMPGHLSGPALAERLRRERPGLKVIYMSGHDSDVLVRRLGITPGQFLAKPFELPALLRIVRHTLDESAATMTG